LCLSVCLAFVVVAVVVVVVVGGVVAVVVVVVAVVVVVVAVALAPRRWLLVTRPHNTTSEQEAAASEGASERADDRYCNMGYEQRAPPPLGAASCRCGTTVRGTHAGCLVADAEERTWHLNVARPPFAASARPRPVVPEKRAAGRQLDGAAGAEVRRLVFFFSVVPLPAIGNPDDRTSDNCTLDSCNQRGSFWARVACATPCAATAPVS
jgi:hypothetical protein